MILNIKQDLDFVCVQYRVLERPNAKAVTFCGSPYYMSPEIFSCKPYDEKVNLCTSSLLTVKNNMSRPMGKPTICIGENKGADQRLCFRYTDSTNPKFPVSSHLLYLYSPVCVGPVQKPHCWFSLEVAHIYSTVRCSPRFNLCF